nr:MAG TPA: hypothetical protein [Caudoviricetes sp.]
MEMTNTNETITVKRTIEKDGVLIEETIQVPNEEANLLASYLASNPTEEVQHDHQEEHSSEVNGEVEAVQAKEEEGTGGEETQGVLGDSPEETEVLKDENTIELRSDYDGFIHDPNGLLFGTPIVEEDDEEEEYKESAAEFAARDSLNSGAKQVDGVIVIDDPTYNSEDLPNDLFDSGYTDDEENQDVYALMGECDFDDDNDDVYDMLEEFDDDE